MAILSKTIMQNYRKKSPPKRGNGNYPGCRGNRERVIPIYGWKLYLVTLYIAVLAVFVASAKCEPAMFNLDSLSSKVVNVA